MKQKLLEWLNSQVGYCEGANNYNKYAPEVVQAIGWNAQNQPWCAVFVAAAFLDCFGLEKACAMLRGCVGGISAACQVNADRFESCGNLYNYPEVGDIAYFYYNGGINHEGIVISVDEKTFTTIEGNSGDSVKKNTYYRNNNIVAGFGRPLWFENDDDDGTEDIVHPTTRRRNYFHLEIGDGMNNPLPRVKAWQNHLIEWGFVLDPDGEFGSITKSVTMMWQELAIEKYGANLSVTGAVNEDDWKEIINVPEE